MDDLLVRGLDDDGLFAPKIKEHSLEKIRIHNYYVSMFTTAMREHWDQLAYLGLFSGAGRAQLSGTAEYVETSAMGALRLRFPFTKYIFVDSDARCTEALEQRVRALPAPHDVTLVHRDVSEAVPDILAAMPSFGRDRTLLSFCFADPFSAELDFNVIRQLGSRYRMDFLVLLMLGRDVRTNFKRYLENEEDERIGRLIDDPGWRDEWRERQLPDRDLVAFIIEKFDQAMVGLGYKEIGREDAHPIRIPGKNVFLYSLVFYSKSDLGRGFFKAARSGISPQFDLGL